LVFINLSFGLSHQYCYRNANKQAAVPGNTKSEAIHLPCQVEKILNAQNSTHTERFGDHRNYGERLLRQNWTQFNPALSIRDAVILIINRQARYRAGTLIPFSN
jgi:hypothetical protein